MVGALAMMVEIAAQTTDHSSSLFSTLQKSVA